MNNKLKVKSKVKLKETVKVTARELATEIDMLNERDLIKKQLMNLIEITELNIASHVRYRIEQLIEEELIKKLRRYPQFFAAVIELSKKY